MSALSENKQDSTFPRFKVNGKVQPDAKSAAQAFFDINGKKGVTGIACVETSYERAYELGGINASGDKYLNHLHFQQDPMMKAFKAEYAALLNPQMAIDPIKQAQQAQPSAPIQPSPGEVAYPRIMVAQVPYADTQSAAKAFASMSSDKAYTGAVTVETEKGRAFEVAGINADGHKYLNTSHFQGHELMKDFQADYANETRREVAGIDLKALQNVEPLERKVEQDFLRSLAPGKERENTPSREL